MRYREPFTVFPRKMKSGRIVWYYQTYDDFGKRTTAISTGLITKSAARAMCRKLQKEDKLIPARGGRITFEAYAINWWDWEKCEYLRFKRSRKDISEKYANTGLQTLNDHILPYFKLKRLEEIKSHDIELWLHTLVKKELSPGTANLCLRYFRIMLTDAIRRDILKEDPSQQVPPLRVEYKTRGILSREMVGKLFNKENRSEYWPNKKCYLANLLAACTGMRIGEVRGLQFSDLKKGYISITKQYQSKYGISPTKTRESREVPVPEELLNLLHELSKNDDDSFVFESDRMAGKPMNSTTFWKSLRSALNKAGMSPQEVEENHITFHSWRHYFNTIMRSNNISDSKLQKMTGHKSSVMTDHYTHYEVEDLKEVGKIQAKILPFSNAG